MDEALQGLNRVSHIVDDCLVASETWEQHIEDVEALLERCREKNISLNPDKFCFGQETVTFAGIQMSQGGFTIDPNLLQAVRDFPTPMSKTDVRSFFGLVNQLSSHTDQLSHLLATLQPLLKKDNHFAWDGTHQQAFDKI